MGFVWVAMEVAMWVSIRAAMEVVAWVAMGTVAEVVVWVFLPRFCTHTIGSMVHWQLTPQASGFCYVNDIVLAILELLKSCSLLQFFRCFLIFYKC